MLSSLIRQLGSASTKATFGIGVGAIVTLWAVIGLFAGFPTWWQTVLYSVSSSVTLLMVFVLQHTQNHQQMAVQRKLDELIRSFPHADDRLISAEAASTDELLELSELHLAKRSEATVTPPLPPSLHTARPNP